MREQIILMDKHASIILALRDTTQQWYISSLAKTSGTTYVHASTFLLKCEKLGIVISNKHGKSKIIKLTESGAKIAEMVYAIHCIVHPAQLNEIKEDKKN